MKLLVYLGHPAHFHLFKGLILDFRKKNHEVRVVIKSKDVLETLMQESGMEYELVIGRGKGGGIGVILNFLKRIGQLSAIVKKEKPDVLIGSAAELAIIGKMKGIPSYVFFEDDFEIAPAFAWLAGPLATRLVCPECCSAGRWKNKKTGYQGYHELAYLHPSVFTPDKSKTAALAADGRPYYILRFASLSAYHDRGKSGITTALATRIISLLEKHGHVYITSERELEPQFEKYRIRLNVLDMHHALAFATMYIGDSQTMTAEAAVLGTPALRFNDFVGKLSYLEELEHQYQLTFGFRTDSQEQLMSKIMTLLEIHDLKTVWEQRRTTMLADKSDPTFFMAKLIETDWESAKKR